MLTVYSTEIQFKIICIALFTIQSLQSSCTGNYVSTIYLYIAETLIYLTYGNIWLILYTLWGVVIISSQVFGISDHLRVDPDWSLCNS